MACEKISSYFISSSMLLIYLLLCPVGGDYVLRVRVHSYGNPSNRCAACGLGQGCCDLFILTECDSQPSHRCDNEFFFCARPLGTTSPSLLDLSDTVAETSVESRATELQCKQPTTALRTSVVNTDGTPIDFSASNATFFGLPNPLEFEIAAEQWGGIQLYADVIDKDDAINPTNDLVDSFVTNIEPFRLSTNPFATAPHNVSGVFGFSFMTLSLEIQCLPGFSGENCTRICSRDPCRNGGTCLENANRDGSVCACVDDFTGENCEIRRSIDPCQGVDCNDGTCLPSGAGGFTCVCSGDYTGDTCQNRIDHCQGVECSNNGSCVDGDQSFTCLCQQGFTGQLCDIFLSDTTTTTTNNSDATFGSTSSEPEPTTTTINSSSNNNNNNNSSSSNNVNNDINSRNNFNSNDVSNIESKRLAVVAGVASSIAVATTVSLVVLILITSVACIYKSRKAKLSTSIQAIELSRIDESHDRSTVENELYWMKDSRIPVVGDGEFIETAPNPIYNAFSPTETLQGVASKGEGNIKSNSVHNVAEDKQGDSSEEDGVTAGPIYSEIHPSCKQQGKTAGDDDPLQTEESDMIDNAVYNKIGLLQKQELVDDQKEAK